MTRSFRARMRSRALPLFVALGAVATAACDGTTFQVIEGIEFDPSLGINLDSMTRLESGVYIRDSVIGTGNTIFPNSDVRVTYVGYINDGSSFGSSGSEGFGFGMGTNSVIPGFEIGLLGMNQGGIRRMIVPPELGYGDENQTGIPAGSVLIFDVEAIEVISNDEPN
jgi:peptidylprolyl isomerase